MDLVVDYALIVDCSVLSASFFNSLHVAIHKDCQSGNQQHIWPKGIVSQFMMQSDFINASNIPDIARGPSSLTCNIWLSSTFILSIVPFTSFLQRCNFSEALLTLCPVQSALCLNLVWCKLLFNSTRQMSTSPLRLWHTLALTCFSSTKTQWKHSIPLTSLDNPIIVGVFVTVVRNDVPIIPSLHLISTLGSPKQKVDSDWIAEAGRGGK